MVLTSTEIPAPSPVLKHVGEYFRFSFTAMGSPCEVMFRGRSEAAARDLETAVLDWVGRFEAAASRYRPGSEVSRINAAAGGNWVEVGEPLAELFALCDWFHWLTNGVFDPTAGPLLGLWDYHPPRRARVPTAEEIEAAKRRTGWPRVQRDGRRVRLPDAGMSIDLGGIGKEYAVDHVMQMAEAAGIRDALVNFGHDLKVIGSPPEGGGWRIGLEDPTTPGRCWCGIAVNRGAVCTSGDYLRYLEIDGKRYGHIVDPRTGYPVDNGCLSVSVIAPSCTEAGMLCTAAFILGPEAGLELINRTFGAEGCLWTRQGVAQSGRFGSYVIRQSG